MRTLAVLGTGSNAGLIADLLEDIGSFRLTAFVENLDRARCGRDLYGKAIIWIDELDPVRHGNEVICAMPAGMQRKFIEAVSARGFQFATLVHPSCVVSGSCCLEPGVAVLAGAVIGPYTNIAQHCFVNRGAIIGHHVQIGPRSVINPGANVAGSCEIGEDVVIGMGALIRDHIRVGARARIGMGAVVTKDVAADTLVLGNPARVEEQ